MTATLRKPMSLTNTIISHSATLNYTWGFSHLASHKWVVILHQEIKSLPFYRWHFQMYSLENYNCGVVIKIHMNFSQVSNQQKVINGSNNGLLLEKCQVSILTHDVLFLWCKLIGHYWFYCILHIDVQILTIIKWTFWCFIVQCTFYPCICFYVWLSLFFMYFVRNDKNEGDQSKSITQLQRVKASWKQCVNNTVYGNL